MLPGDDKMTDHRFVRARFLSARFVSQPVLNESGAQRAKSNLRRTVCR